MGLLPSSKLQTFERTVKIRRKSVRRQFKHFLTFDPRVKIEVSKRSLQSLDRFFKPRSYSSSHLDIVLGYLCSSIILPGFLYFFQKKTPKIKKKKKKKKKKK